MNGTARHQSTKRGLIVFAREPKAGYVKTRLTSMLDPEEAARLYAAFLEDSLRQYKALSVPVHVFVAPGPTDVAMPTASWFMPSTSVRLQRGADLGERLEAAFAELFDEGNECLVVIGTDHPTLPSAFIEQAFEALEKPGVVALGPAEDGGYYLLGLNAPAPDLFMGMVFSHADVFSETVQRAARAGREPRILPVWYDVDEPADLRRLGEELRDSPGGCSRTREVLAGLRERYGW